MNPKPNFLLYISHLKKWFSKQFVLIFIFFFGISSALFSQSVVSGKITNEQGVGIAQVSVTEKGKKNGTTTDNDGSFTLTVNPKATLAVSSVGFVSQEIPVNGRSSFSVALKTSNTQMEEVVVTGYGTARRATLTGAISTIKGSDVTKSPATNVSNNLVGRLPGLSAVQPSGEPGYDGSQLRIRGANTLNDNSVLVVVDGVAGRSLERIDPNSIENITVLKDASAAIYGSRAANGVILITTKRGKTGKPLLGLNINTGYNQPTRYPKMADAATFAQLNNEIIIYNKLGSATGANEWAAAFNALKTTGSYTSPNPATGTISASSLPIDGSPAGIELYRNGQDPWGVCHERQT